MTIFNTIADHATATPSRPAMIVADGVTITYEELHRQVDGVATALCETGVSAGDTVGIALRDGVDMALTFLAVGAVAAAAPLNPSYRRGEFDFEIDDLGLAAMIVGEGDAEIEPATEAADAAGIPVIRIGSKVIGNALEMTVDGAIASVASSGQRTGMDDVALVLHTSGTTSRPKIVPLTNRNLMASATAIVRTLSLSPVDRVCNVMPLFHIHGLVAGLCSSLVGGATVICTTGFSAPDMARWLVGHQATWYTAVPTMHQALLERRASFPDEFNDVELRFIRSSSSSLAPVVMESLEAAFGCPVVEAYGMTEAAHQMACNPLPPATRKPGSVGPAAGPEVAIMNDAGELLEAGIVGEVVIKGPNVTTGYHDNAEANAAAFTNGWFRTGDQGRMDTDGYLFLTGRLKEIINRAGEKVSPREIDEVILEHPGVAQVVTFAVPDSRLGEQVAAAVVTTGGSAISERQLREYCSEHLAPYKVPRRIVFLDTIPKGPSGKLRRIGLSEQLGLQELDAHGASGGHVEPESAAELLMAELWAEVLGRENLSVNDHFLDVGGDSLAATRLLTRVRDEIDVEVSMLDFFDSPTIAQQAVLVEQALLQSEPV